MLAWADDLPAPVPPNMPPYAVELWQRITKELPGSFQRIRPSLAAILLMGCLAGGRCAKGFADRRHQRCKAFFELYRNAINDMTRIATKLRLCPSTRVRAESASLHKTATAKPWDAAS